MSKLEIKYFEKLKEIDKEIVSKKKILLKNGRYYESDFYLPTLDIFIELKGIMTLEKMTRYFLISQQIPNFYVVQATERDWSKSIEQQLEDIKQNKNLSKITQESLLKFIRLKIDIFLKTTGLNVKTFLPE